MAAAAKTERLRVTVIPKTWKKGKLARLTSLPMSTLPIQALICCTLNDRLRWVSMTALDTPVVPPVYCRTAISSMPISTRGGCGDPSSMRWLIKWIPSSESTFAIKG